MTSRQSTAPKDDKMDQAPVATGGLDTRDPVDSAAGMEGSRLKSWLRQASAEQISQCLELYRRQGFLTENQLSASKASSGSLAVTVQGMLLGRTPGSFPVPGLCRVIQDPELSEEQRQAVSGALATPDIALLRIDSNSGKTAVVAEMIRQVLRENQTALLLSSRMEFLTAALDRVGPAHPSPEMVLWCQCGSGRCEGNGAVNRFDLCHQVQTLRSTVFARVSATQEARRRDLEALQKQGPFWDRLEEIARHRNHIQGTLEQVLESGSALSAHGASESSPNGECDPVPGGQAVERKRALESQLAALHAQTDQLQCEHRQWDSLRGELVPLVEAGSSYRWWTGAFWKARFGKNNRGKMEEVSERCRKVAERLEESRQRQRDLEDELRSLANEHEIGKNIHTDGFRRDADRMQGKFQQDLAELDHAWRRALEETGITRNDLPCHSAAVEEAREKWNVRSTALAEEVSRLDSWMQALQKPDADLRSELIDQARILAIPMTRPTGLSPAQNGFSWIILDDADQATEQEVLDLAARASHLILLGDSKAAPSSGSSPSASTFQRLWHGLHEESRRSGVRCGDFANRLAFTLRNLPLEHHAFLQREPLFDRPEIELGIVSLPGQEPCIAEVLFPEKVAIAEAKRFIYRELQQLPLQTEETSPRWVEGPSVIRILFMAEKGDATLVELEPGVRERVVLRRKDGSKEYGCWHTESLEFDRRAGWDRPRVRAWLNSFLQGSDPSRIFDLMPVNGTSHGGAKSPNGTHRAPSPTSGVTVAPIAAKAPPDEFLHGQTGK